MNSAEFDSNGIDPEMIEVIHQLGELRDLALENYISELIKRSDSVKFATRILHYLDMINEQSTRLSDKSKKANAEMIAELLENLQKKYLSPMERRFIYAEISDITRSMDSLRQLWLQKSLKGLKYVGAAGAVVAAALFFQKRK